MRRQRRIHYLDDEEDYRPNLQNGSGTSDYFNMERQQSPYRENTIEAKVEDGDTLQALALRFHCSVTDIKRLNKIDKDNEIHARKVVKIPLTVHSVLLGGLPSVHKSENGSPRHSLQEDNDSNIMRNPLEETPIVLGNKLIAASVNSSSSSSPSSDPSCVNNIILNSKITRSTNVITDGDCQHSNFNTASSMVDQHDMSAPLLKDILGDDDAVPELRIIRGPSFFDWSGSDCDMHWVCLFAGILALCFVIPLGYVIYLAETDASHHHHNITNKHH